MEVTECDLRPVCPEQKGAERSIRASHRPGCGPRRIIVTRAFPLSDARTGYSTGRDGLRRPCMWRKHRGGCDLAVVERSRAVCLGGGCWSHADRTEPSS